MDLQAPHMIGWPFRQDHRPPLAVVPLVLSWELPACTYQLVSSFASEDGLFPRISDALCPDPPFLTRTAASCSGKPEVTVICLIRANILVFPVLAC